LEPITLAEARQHLNISEADGDDDYVTALIMVARQACEDQTNLSLLTQTRRGFAERFDSVMSLSRSPVQSVSSVNYYDTDNVLQTVSTDDYFFVNGGAHGRIGFVDDYSFPDVYKRPDAVQVEYVAGFGDAASDVPSPIRHAMLLLIGTWYAQRESISAEELREVPNAVQFLLSPHRVFDGMLP